jgi:predicted nucleic acid-binding protein
MQSLMNISEQAADALSNYRAFPVERQDVLPLWPRLKSLHANLSAYDAEYVALAEALHVPLITADARVKRSGVARCDRSLRPAHLTGAA